MPMTLSVIVQWLSTLLSLLQSYDHNNHTSHHDKKVSQFCDLNNEVVHLQTLKLLVLQSSAWSKEKK